MRKTFVSVFAAVLSLFAFDAKAELEFEASTTDDGMTFVMVSGDFESRDDLSLFQSIVRRSNPSVVAFNSPGGNVVKAMELGRLIRSLRLDTMQPRGLECSSACALAFMGGVERYAEAGAIGVHKSSFAPEVRLSVDEAVSAVQHLTAEIIAYMGEMGVDPSLLQLALQYEKDDIRYLSKSEMAKFRVTGGGASVSGSSVAPASPRPTYTPPATSRAPAAAQSNYIEARSGRVLHPKGTAPLKSRPNDNGADLMTLQNGQTLTIHGSSDRWYHVRRGGLSGYMHHTWVHVDQYHAGEYGQRFIQIMSAGTLEEVADFMRKSSVPTAVYITTNGWYAVTVAGTFTQDESRRLVSGLKSTKKIPADSFATFGTTYIRKVCCN